MYYEKSDLLIATKALLTAPTLFALLEEDLANQLEDLELFSVEEYEVTPKGRSFLSDNTESVS